LGIVTPVKSYQNVKTCNGRGEHIYQMLKIWAATIPILKQQYFLKLKFGSVQTFSLGLCFL